MRKRGKLSFSVRYALFQALDLAAAIEEACFLTLSAATRKRTARIQQFAIERHDAQPPAHLLLDGKTVV